MNPKDLCTCGHEYSWHNTKGQCTYVDKDEICYCSNYTPQNPDKLGVESFDHGLTPVAESSTTSSPPTKTDRFVSSDSNDLIPTEETSLESQNKKGDAQSPDIVILDGTPFILKSKNLSQSPQTSKPLNDGILDGNRFKGTKTGDTTHKTFDEEIRQLTMKREKMVCDACGEEVIVTLDNNQIIRITRELTLKEVEKKIDGFVRAHPQSISAGYLRELKSALSGAKA